MSLYQSVTNMKWEQTSSGTVFQKKETASLQEFLSSVFQTEQPLYALCCPELADSLLLLNLSEQNLNLLLAVPDERLFFGSVQKSAEKERILLTLLRNCTDFLSREKELTSKEYTVPAEQEPPKAYYHDYWRARFGEKYFRLIKYNCFSNPEQKTPVVLISAFPAGGGGVWSCLLFPEKNGKFSHKISHESSMHFRQSVWTLLPELINMPKNY